MKKKIEIYFLLSLLLLSVLFFNMYYLGTSVNFTENVDLEVVVSRYNEKLEWLSEQPFRKYQTIVYNKGNNEDYSHPQNLRHWEQLPNVGRESHTYLYHIINNYDNLADITIFLPGSVDSHTKLEKATILLNHVLEHRNTVFLGKFVHNGWFDDFTVESYNATSKENTIINPDQKPEPAEIRPFGEWFKRKFQNNDNTVVAGFGIFALSKYDIVKKPVEYYKNLIIELEKSSNPEVGHFFERAWYAVFYPYENAKKVEYMW